MSSTKQLIEIAGVWLPNKGAELMAHTAISELSARLPGAEFCSADQGPAEDRALIGMPAFPAELPSKRQRLLPAAIGLRLWRRSRPKITHVVDISGFAYGDHWGATKARNRAGLRIRAGYPVYLLPQAFGPFENHDLRTEMTFITRNARFIAARDKVSLDNLMGLNAERDIPLLPDVTLSLDVSERQVELRPKRYGCLVLNQKTIGAGSLSEGALLSLYNDISALYQSHGLLPLIVLHEPRADRALSQKLAAMTGIEIVDLEDARDIKRVIAGAECVVTGRFHGLANGLSNAVPSFAVSWSHKYHELLADFGCENAVFEADTTAFLKRISNVLSEPAAHLALRKQLGEQAAQKKAKLAAFWDNVADDILRSS